MKNHCERAERGGGKQNQIRKCFFHFRANHTFFAFTLGSGDGLTSDRVKGRAECEGKTQMIRCVAMADMPMSALIAVRVTMAVRMVMAMTLRVIVTVVMGHDASNNTGKCLIPDYSAR